MLSSFWQASLDSKGMEVFEANSLGALKAQIVEYWLGLNQPAQALWSVDLVYEDEYRLNMDGEALDRFNADILHSVLGDIEYQPEREWRA